jgi:hypothetical protein
MMLEPSCLTVRRNLRRIAMINTVENAAQLRRLPPTVGDSSPNDFSAVSIG